MACLHQFENRGRQTARPVAKLIDTKLSVTKKPQQKYPPLHLFVYTNLHLRRHPRKLPGHEPHLILIWVTNLPNIPPLRCLAG